MRPFFCLKFMGLLVAYAIRTAKYTDLNGRMQYAPTQGPALPRIKRVDDSNYHLTFAFLKLIP